MTDDVRGASSARSACHAEGYPRLMAGPISRASEEGPSRAESRRLRQRSIEERARRLAERDAFLESALDPGERIVARRRNHPFVTDRRILDARALRDPPRRGEWVVDELPFDEITGWSLGAKHDSRPTLRAEHLPRSRIDLVPVRKLLLIPWGDREATVTRTTTSYGFGKHTNPVLLAIRAELERRRIPQGSPFTIQPAGTRAERMKGSEGVLYRSGGTAWIRFRLWRVTDVIYRGKPAWPLRIISWILFAVPAWFVSPWLVLPAVPAAELAWIAGLRWLWHRNRARRDAPS